MLRQYLTTLVHGVVLCACAAGREPAVRPPPPAGPAAQGSARVFRIANRADLLSGPNATGKLGDYRLDNGLVAFIIDDLSGKAGFAASGGNVVDIARAPEWQDAFNQTFLYLDDTFPRQAVWTKLELLDTAADGSVAVRVAGLDVNDPNLALTHEYRLAPGSQALQLVTTVTNLGAHELGAYELGDALQWGKTEHFAVKVGYDLGGKVLELDWVAGVGEKVSYALTRKSGRMVAQSGSSWTDVIHSSVDLGPGAKATFERYLVVGGGDVTSLYSSVARLRGESVVRLTGRVTDSDARAVARAELWFDRPDPGSGDKPFAFAHADADGRYVAELPAGAYRVRIEGEGVRTPSPAPLTLETASERDWRVAAGGVLQFSLREHGAPSPGKIVVMGVGDTPSPRFGRFFSANGAANVVLTHDGTGQAKLPIGKYKVYACRGPEYDVALREIEVKSGDHLDLSFELVRVLDTRGYLSGDFHQHAANSFDSGATLVDRVISNVAEGLDILVSTDHDFVTDYRPIIGQLGLSGSLVTVPGDEATTHTIGHFIAFPMQPRPNLPRNGAPDTWGKTPSQIFRDLRADPLDKIVQVNHPRAANTGYFDLFHLDASDAGMHDPALDVSFDAIEVLNGKRIDEARKVLADWMHFLSMGKRYTATGNSDSHAMVFQEAGYPRNFVRMSEDLTRFDQSALVEAVKRRHAVTVSNGPFLELFAVENSAAAPAQIGDTLEIEGDKVSLRYKLQAAPWVQVTGIEIWQDGNKVKDLAVAQSRQVLRAEGSVELAVPKSGGYVMALAFGDQALEPVLPTQRNKPARAFAFTNPIYFSKKPSR